MVRVIMGAKGTGKTKQLIDMINHAADNEGGSVVCVEIGKKLVYDVSPKVRLVESSDFAADNFTFLKGFISGMYASNYDLTHVFIDSLCRIIPSEPDSPEVEEFLAWLDRFSDTNKVKFTFLKGFISGMYASNYDLTHVFIDSLCRIIPSEPDSPEVEEFLAWLDRFSDTNKVKFTITISADIALATEAIKAYF